MKERSVFVIAGLIGMWLCGGCACNGAADKKVSEGAEIRGEVVFEGGSSRGWQVHIQRIGSVGDVAEVGVTEVEVGRGGGFVASVPQAGEYQISVTSPRRSEGEYAQIRDRIQVLGKAVDWRLRVKVGSVVVEGLEELPSLRAVVEGRGDVKRGYWASARLVEGQTWEAGLVVEKGRRWVIENAPAGKVRIGEITPENYFMPVEERKEKTGVIVRAGESTQVELDR